MSLAIVDGTYTFGKPPNMKAESKTTSLPDSFNSKVKELFPDDNNVFINIRNLDTKIEVCRIDLAKKKIIKCKNIDMELSQ